MYRAVTRQIEVTVEPNFLPERSSVDRGQYFWSYTIVITNTGAETVQLRTRHWIITDATGRKQEVRGEGVVGEQPVLAPGDVERRTRIERLRSGVPIDDKTLADLMRAAASVGIDVTREKRPPHYPDRVSTDLPDVWDHWTPPTFS